MDTNTVRQKYNLENIKAKKEELENAMATGHRNNANMSQLSIDLNHFSTLFGYITELYKSLEIYEQAKNILDSEKDPEMIEMANQDIGTSSEKIKDLEAKIYSLEVERQFSDPDDMKSVILEIRAGAGGEEAALFASELFRMYSLFASSKGWSCEIIDSSVAEGGGFKEIIANIKGKNAYKLLKYESGVHRVQRIPTTESSGRIHTSTASVAVLPEAEDIEVNIDPAELRIDVMRAGGAGGQCVNRTDSAVRITHIPTGIVVSCQETKHQDQNKVKAMNILRARLYDRQKQEADAKRSDLRSSQIGSAMRAEKIRTYNFPQSRITDHRIKQSWHNIEGVMNGNIEEMVSTIREEIFKGQVVIGKNE